MSFSLNYHIFLSYVYSCRTLTTLTSAKDQGREGGPTEDFVPSLVKDSRVLGRSIAEEELVVFFMLSVLSFRFGETLGEGIKK